MAAGQSQPHVMQNEDEILKQAESLESRGGWIEAASVLRDYQRITTLSVEALGKLAYYCSRAGDYEGSITLYKDLSNQQPSEARWFYALGFQYQQKEMWPEAIAAYEHALHLAPRWLGAAQRLGDAYQAAGQGEKALQVYRKGMQSYQEIALDRRSAVAPIYAGICTRVARTLLSKPNPSTLQSEEALKLLRGAVSADPNKADNWYRLGCLMLETGRLDESLDSFQKAETLAPQKEYICHKIAQAHLRKGDPDQALRAYQRIPQQRRAPYILHGIAQCHMAKGEAMEAARKLHHAIQREPGKFYHHWDFALALVTLGAKDQAVEALEEANRLFRREHGKEYRKAMAKLEEVRSTLQAGHLISFDGSPSAVGVISFGSVAKYDTNRGFGFIKDDADGVNVFFHISRVKGRVPPRVGDQTKYVREFGEKGPHAAKVWLLRTREPSSLAPVD